MTIKKCTENKKKALKKKRKIWGFFMLLHYLWPYLRRHPLLLSISIGCMLLFTLLNRLFPLLIGYIIDHGIALKQFSNVAWGVALYATGIVVHTFCNFGQYYLFERYGNRIVFYIRQAIMEHIHSLPTNFFDKNPKGKVATQVIFDTNKLNQIFNVDTFQTVNFIISALSVLLVLFYISPKLSFISLSLSPFFLWFSWKINIKLRRKLHSAKRNLSKLNSVILESLHGMKVLQIHHKKEEKIKHFNKSCQEYRNRHFSISLQSARLRGIMTLFQASILTLALGFGFQMKLADAISIGALTAFIINVQHLPFYLRMIFENYQSLQDSITSGERILSLLKQTPEKDSSSQSPVLSSFQQRQTPSYSNPMPQDHLQIKNLSFRYSSNEPWVLKNINLKIAHGESMAIVGRTGSGKSTLVSLLQKNYPSFDGEILLDGQSIKNISIQQLRKQINLVRQDDFIFSGSILNNITLQDPSISIDKIYEVINEIGYLQLLHRTGRNLHFFLKEGGVNISMGERQLITLARIFVNEPQMVILDEVNAHMDFKYEHLLQKLIQKIAQKQTCLMISHKIHNITQCDSILVLNEGEIVDRGSHSQLLKSSEIYRNYFKKYFTLKVKSEMKETCA